MSRREQQSGTIRGPDDWFDGRFDETRVADSRSFDDVPVARVSRHKARLSPGRLTALAAGGVFFLLLVLAVSGLFSGSSSPNSPRTPPASGRSGNQSPPSSPVKLPAGVVRPGAAGPQVKEIQSALTAAGQSPGAADGVFGRGTLQALQNFQRSAGLLVDGVYGPTTEAALERALRSG
jgi:hypothetical protein